MIDYFLRATIMLPVMLLFLLADRRLKTDPLDRQIKTDALLFCAALIPLVTLFIRIPGGSLSDIPPEIRSLVDYIAWMGLAPLAGLLLFSVQLLVSALWKSWRGHRRRADG